MSSNPELLQELLRRGVPWPIAREAIASTALDADERARTHSVVQLREESEQQSDT